MRNIRSGNLVKTSVDIESLLTFNEAGENMGRPQENTVYARIDSYSPNGINKEEIPNAYITPAQRAESYTRDVFTLN